MASNCCDPCLSSICRYVHVREPFALSDVAASDVVDGTVDARDKEAILLAVLTREESHVNSWLLGITSKSKSCFLYHADLLMFKGGYDY